MPECGWTKAPTDFTVCRTMLGRNAYRFLLILLWKKKALNRRTIWNSFFKLASLLPPTEYAVRSRYIQPQMMSGASGG